MKISVVTINYNNLIGLEKTVECVLAQEGVIFEYIIVDGESSDGSDVFIRNVIDSEAARVSYLIEKDSGISNAFNKAIDLCSGDFILMLNSGDVFFSKSTLKNIEPYLANEYDVVYGKVLTDDNFYLGESSAHVRADSIPHQGAFVANKAYEKYGFYDESLRIRMDYEIFSRFIASKAEIKMIDDVISIFEMGGVSSDHKNRGLFYREACFIDLKYKNIQVLGNFVRWVGHKVLQVCRT